MEHNYKVRVKYIKLYLHVENMTQYITLVAFPAIFHVEIPKENYHVISIFITNLSTNTYCSRNSNSGILMQRLRWIGVYLRSHRYSYSYQLYVLCNEKKINNTSSLDVWIYEKDRRVESIRNIVKMDLRALDQILKQMKIVRSFSAY